MGRRRLELARRSSPRSLGAVFLHAGTNIVNEVYDVRKGIDTITAPRASHAIVKGRMNERRRRSSPSSAFGLAVAVGLYLVWLRGPAIIVLGLLGLVGGYGYTAPPFEYKYRALGVPLVFLLMGPLMVEGAYFAVSGEWSMTALVLSIPVGLLVAAILHGNEWRDISEDTRAGISTLSARIGRRLGALRLRRRSCSAPTSRSALAVVAGVLPPARCSRSCRCRCWRGDPLRRARRGRPGAGDRDDRPADRAAAPGVRRLLVLGLVLSERARCVSA